MKYRILLILALAWILQPLVTASSPPPKIVEGNPFSRYQVTKLQPIKAEQFKEVSELPSVEVPKSTPPPAPSPAVNTASSNCGDNEYAHYIYWHESSCSTTSTNYLGCYGIGQNCASDVRNQCGPDYTCQNRWFTNYANTHCDYHLGYPLCYNGWAGAKAFWVQFHYW